MRAVLTPYRVMASIVGVLLIILVLIGLPLHYGHLLNEARFPKGGSAEQLGATISATLGVAHGWLDMAFLVVAFVLSRRAGWDLTFTLTTMLMGTVPILSFWAEHRATVDVRRRIAAQEAAARGAGQCPAVAAPSAPQPRLPPSSSEAAGCSVLSRSACCGRCRRPGIVPDLLLGCPSAPSTVRSLRPTRAPA